MSDLLEADLGTLTDQEWRDAHEAVVVPQVPANESAFDWRPEVVDKTGFGYEPTETDFSLEAGPLTLVPYLSSAGPRTASPLTADDGDRARIRQIITRLRENGVVVREMADWGGRGATWTRVPRALIDHHDASSRASGEWGALGIIVSGRTGIPGPLSQFQGARCLDGVPKVAVCAAGRANHAGTGGPVGPVPANAGNSWMYGVEWANDGLGEPYTQAAMHAKVTLFRAILEVCAA